MFIERSQVRIHWMRLLFVLVCILPTGSVVGWALLRVGKTHENAILEKIEQSFGLRFNCEFIEHVRPGVVRLNRCEVFSSRSSQRLKIDSIDVEEASDGTRVRIPKLSLTPHAVGELAHLASLWLSRPLPRSIGSNVLELDEVVWSSGKNPLFPETSSFGGFWIECVADESMRAIRIRREPQSEDEVRVRSMPLDAGRVEVIARANNPVPWEMVCQLLGWRSLCGENAFVRGTIDCSRVAGLWSGTCTGRLENISLEQIAHVTPHALSGIASIEWTEGVFSRGRLISGTIGLHASQGSLSRSLIDSLVTFLGCRSFLAGSLARAPTIAFDQLSLVVRLAESKIFFESNSMQQPLVMKNKISIVECPNGSVAVECVPDALFSSANNKVVGDPWKRWWSETLLFLNDEKSLSLGEDLLLR